MSRKTEIVYGEDKDKEEFKLEPTDTAEEVGGGDTDPLNTEQESHDTVKRKKKVIEEDSYDQCEYIATHPSYLKRHKVSKHEGIRYPCDQCEFVFISELFLKRHVQSTHKELRCDQCEYVATRQTYLKSHKIAIHERRTSHICPKCDYSGSESEVIYHQKYRHKGRYPCDQCEYAATHQSALKIHKTSKHEGIRSGECIATGVSEINMHRVAIHKERAAVITVEPDFIEESDSSVEDTEIKKEITEEEPLSDTNQKSNTLRILDSSKNFINTDLNTEQMMLKEELEYEDCEPVTKIEIVDDKLPPTKSENSELQ